MRAIMKSLPGLVYSIVEGKLLSEGNKITKWYKGKPATSEC